MCSDELGETQVPDTWYAEVWAQPTAECQSVGTSVPRTTPVVSRKPPENFRGGKVQVGRWMSKVYSYCRSLPVGAEHLPRRGQERESE